jgi:sugar lactone lactonase YvrE
MGQQSITPSSRLIALLWVGGLLPFFLLISSAHSQTPANILPLILPSAVVFDAQGNLYIAETGSHAIRKVDVAGNITTIAGNGTQGFSGDNGPATAAELDSPQGLALDGNQTLYIADTHNQRIRKLDLATGLISTVAGSTAGFFGDSGPAAAARLNFPTALTIDANHNLYIADTQNQRIRKIASTGIITTIAGTGTQGFSGDNGPATAASIDSPSGMAVNSGGDLFLSDTHNHRIRKIDATTGIITTVAGTGAPAVLALPHGLSIDHSGNLYIADTENHRVRRIDAATGIVSTVAGSGTQAFSGDNGPAALATLDSPRNTAFSPAGLLTLTDTGNQRIRQLDAESTPAIRTIAGIFAVSGSALALTAPPSIVYGTGQLTASLAAPATGSVTFTLLDPATGTSRVLGSAPLTPSTAAYDTSTLPVGSYMLVASYAGDLTHAAAQSSALFLRITPRPLFVTANPITLLYGQAIPPLNGTLSGLLAQDNGSVTASFTASATAESSAGVYPISASIAGNSAKNYAMDTVPASLTIRPAPTVATLAAPVASIVSGTPLTLTTHIASTTAGIPTGLVSLMDGTTTLLSLVSSSGNATFVTSNLTPGLHALTTLYAGDKNFLSSMSSPTLITVVPSPTTSADFTLTPTGATSQTIPSGSSANFNFALQIQSATLSSPIALSATGLPALATASFNPASLPPGITPNNFVLTINTPQSVALQRNSRTASPLLALLLFPLTGIAVRQRTRRKLKASMAFLILASLLVFSGCESRINTGDPAVSPVKTYTITVTGTATGPTGSILQHSATVKLLIQSVS